MRTLKLKEAATAKVVYTNHAFDQMADREISVAQVEETVRRPATRYLKDHASQEGKQFVFERQYNYPDTGTWTLRVIGTPKSVLLVVTTYWVNGVDGRRVRRRG